jgi:sulfite exporter TauE/SafE
MSSINSAYALMLVSGFLGGFGHCVGMCGPIVAAHALNPAGNRFLPHLLYNLGRITTYAMVGGLLGLTGSFAGVIQPMENFQNLLMAAIGLLMVVMGFVMGGWLPLAIGQSGCGWKPIGAMVRFVSETGGVGAFFPMGLILGFIPCGMSYTAFIAAAGAGVQAANQVQGFLQGMLMLLLFGLGTAPALLLLGRIVSLIGLRARLKLHRASSIAMILAGGVFFYRAVLQ